jgi:hypothetical protein
VQILIARQGFSDPELIQADCTLHESHEDTATVTTRPVERTVAITDHVQPEPATISADLFFSDSPIRTPASNVPTGFVLTEQVKQVAGAGAMLLTPSTKLDHVSRAYERLVAMCAGGELCDIVTSVRSYKNMLLTRVALPRDAGQGDGVTITVDAKQVRFVETQQVVITLKPRHQPAKDKGSQPTDETDHVEIAPQTDALTAFAGG